MAGSQDPLRAVLDSVFAAPDYRWVERPRPLAFLSHWVSGVQRWLRELQDTHPLGFQLLLAALVVVLVVIFVHAAWVVWRTVRPDGDTALPAPPAPARRDAAWYRAEADRLAAAGHYPEAMQADFLALVKGLEGPGLLRFHPGKTPAEYSREIRLDPARRAAFRELVGLLYGYAFARWPCGPEDYARWRERSAPERYASAY